MTGGAITVRLKIPAEARATVIRLIILIGASYRPAFRQLQTSRLRKRACIIGTDPAGIIAVRLQAVHLPQPPAEAPVPEALLIHITTVTQLCILPDKCESPAKRRGFLYLLQRLLIKTDRSCLFGK